MKNWKARFGTDLTEAAALAGIDLGGMQWVSANMDNTWGDKVGLAFFDATRDVLDRAATFFAMWSARHLKGSTSYNAQWVPCHGSVEMHRAHYSNGAANWMDGHDVPVQPSRHAGLTISHIDFAVVVPFVYYPCAD